jgi:hypothetical protein
MALGRLGFSENAATHTDCIMDGTAHAVVENLYAPLDERCSRVRLWAMLLPRRFSGNQFERYIPEAISVIGIESVCGYTAAEIGRSLGHHVRFSTVFEITAADPIQ